MEPINGWNDIKEVGEYEPIELGGHICIIKGARCETTKTNKKMLVLAFDFAQGDKQAGYFQNQFDMDKKKNPNAKWRGTFYQMYGTIEDLSTAYFKAMILKICESNPGYQWYWDETSLIGKQFGGVFGREEYINDKNENKFSTKCMMIREVNGIENALVPQDKLLPASTLHKDTQNTNSNDFNQYNTLDIASDDLPF